MCPTESSAPSPQRKLILTVPFVGYRTDELFFNGSPAVEPKLYASPLNSNDYCKIPQERRS